MQHCDSTCYHCATTFFLWMKNRLAQFEKPRGKRAQRSGEGNYNECAASSVRPLRVRGWNYEHTAEVVYDDGFGVGADGRDWVQVRVVTPGAKEPWLVHVERDMVY